MLQLIQMLGQCLLIKDKDKDGAFLFNPLIWMKVNKEFFTVILNCYFNLKYALFLGIIVQIRKETTYEVNNEIKRYMLHMYLKFDIILLQVLFYQFLMEGLRSSNDILQDCRIHFPRPKLYGVPIKIVNNTKDDFVDITIEHRSNDSQWDQPSVVYIPQLKKGETVLIQRWPFGKDAPSKLSNVMFNAIPFVGWMVSAKRGWGKDYWSIFCSTSKMSQVLQTDSWAQKWFANIFESDIEQGASLTFNWNSERNLYWVSLYRLSNGESAHYLDAKGNKNPYFQEHQKRFER